MKVKVTLPEGADITDYYGVSLTYKKTDAGNLYGKRIALGIVNSDVSYGATLLYDTGFGTTINSGAETTLTEAFSPTADAVTALKTANTDGEIEFVFIISTGEAGTYEISDVTLLGSAPATSTTPDEE